MKKVILFSVGVFVGVTLSFFVAREFYVSLGMSGFMDMTRALKTMESSESKKSKAELVASAQTMLVVSNHFGTSLIQDREALRKIIDIYLEQRNQVKESLPAALVTEEIEERLQDVVEMYQQ